MIGAIHLVSSTSASYFDREVDSFTIQVPYKFKEPPQKGRVDKSSLEFTNNYGGSCERIFAEIKNGHDSEKMADESTYEVYYSPDKNPMKSNNVVASGIVPVLDTNEKTILYYVPSESGNYKFKAYQRPGHPGTGEIWIEETITVNCDNDPNDSIDEKEIDNGSGKGKNKEKDNGIKQKEDTSQEVKVEQQKIDVPKEDVEEKLKLETDDVQEDTKEQLKQETGATLGGRVEQPIQVDIS